jgi:hypothetical protein
MYTEYKHRYYYRLYSVKHESTGVVLTLATALFTVMDPCPVGNQSMDGSGVKWSALPLRKTIVSGYSAGGRHQERAVDQRWIGGLVDGRWGTRAETR